MPVASRATNGADEKRTVKESDLAQRDETTLITMQNTNTRSMHVESYCAKIQKTYITNYITSVAPLKCLGFINSSRALQRLCQSLILMQASCCNVLKDCYSFTYYLSKNLNNILVDSSGIYPCVSLGIFVIVLFSHSNH